MHAAAFSLLLTLKCLGSEVWNRTTVCVVVEALNHGNQL